VSDQDVLHEFAEAASKPARPAPNFNDRGRRSRRHPYR